MKANQNEIAVNVFDRAAVVQTEKALAQAEGASRHFAVVLRAGGSDPYRKLWSDGVVVEKVDGRWLLPNGKPLNEKLYSFNGYFGTEAAARAFKNR